MDPFSVAIVGTGLVGLGLWLTRGSPGLREGDVVMFPIANLPSGALPPAFPSEGSIGITVRSQSPQAVQGFITHWVKALPDALPVSSVLSVRSGPIAVQKTFAEAVYRHGKRIR